MLEIYLSKIILYSILAFTFGFILGWQTLEEKEKNLDIFGFLKSLKLTSLFESIFTTFAKILKVLTGINIDPEIKK